jgi:hypothetical protein
MSSSIRLILRPAGGLHDEAVPAADIVLDPDHLLAIRERTDLRTPDGQTQVLADLERQRRVAAPRENLQIVVQKHPSPLSIGDFSFLIFGR